MTDENNEAHDEPWGHSGASFDQLKLFTFEDAARAFVFDLSRRYVPALPTALTPEGQAYHDWLTTLYKVGADDGELHVSVYEDDPKKQRFIQRGHLREWCAGRGMRPKFLYHAPVATSPELQCMNPEHPDFSAELEAAISVWTAMYANDEIKRNRGAKKQISAWLTTNRPKLSNAATERVASVANSVKTKAGGAPKAK